MFSTRQLLAGSYRGRLDDSGHRRLIRLPRHTTHDYLPCLDTYLEILLTFPHRFIYFLLSTFLNPIERPNCALLQCNTHSTRSSNAPAITWCPLRNVVQHAAHQTPLLFSLYYIWPRQPAARRLWPHQNPPLTAFSSSQLSARHVSAVSSPRNAACDLSFAYTLGSHRGLYGGPGQLFRSYYPLHGCEAYYLSTTYRRGN